MDLTQISLPIILSVTTLSLVLFVAVYLRFRAYEAKKEHESSALMDDPRMTHTRVPAKARLDREA